MSRHWLRMSAFLGAYVIVAATCGKSGHEASGASTAGTSSGSTGSSGGGGSAAADAGPIVAPQPISPDIVVDQFGYRPSASKIAVIRAPQMGLDSGMTFTPGPMYALVDAHSSKTLLEAAPVPWNGGAVDASSGDKVWWFDFSSVTTPGDYFVLDEAGSVRSDVLTLGDTVYRDVLAQAVRMLFYQRDGFAKTAQYAGADWVDGAAHMGAGQDPECGLYTDGSGKTDLHGGWFDAGDQNKYTNWGASDSIVLLHAFAESPGAFFDDYNIPESGNGVPDVLDETKWELDWLVRMQQADGGVLSIVGQDGVDTPVGGDTAPSLATGPCKYGPETTSASLTTAAALAYAAVVFKSSAGASAAYPDYAEQLIGHAEHAWTWAQANPAVFFYNSQNGVGAGEQEVPNTQPAQGYALLVKQLQATAYLFMATGNTTYRDFFDAHYTGINLVMSSYADVWHVEEQDTLLSYTQAPGATAAVVQKIKAAYQTAVQSSINLGAVQQSTDPYLAYLQDYVWGSNQTKADQGNLLYDVVTFAIDPTLSAASARGAEGYIHYVHGVNPLQLVYLSNMGDYGANKSVTRFFHTWFANGSMWDAFGVSKYGPPPGYLTGGANPSYTWDSCCPNGCSGVSCGAAQLSPPAGQPPQKSYLDFNGNWPLDSWQVTEPDDGYQAKYIRLLSKFVK